MESNRLKEIKKKVDRLNDQNRFEEAIDLIETLSEEEKDLEIKVFHANLLNNIAMITLGDFDEAREHYEPNDADDENSPKIPYIRQAIERLETLKEEGKEDSYWNKRMASAYYSMGHVLENQSFYYYSLALPYFTKWFEVAEKRKRVKHKKWWMSVRRIWQIAILHKESILMVFPSSIRCRGSGMAMNLAFLSPEPRRWKKRV